MSPPATSPPHSPDACNLDFDDEDESTLANDEGESALAKGRLAVFVTGFPFFAIKEQVKKDSGVCGAMEIFEDESNRTESQLTEIDQGDAPLCQPLCQPWVEWMQWAPCISACRHVL